MARVSGGGGRFGGAYDRVFDPTAADFNSSLFRRNLRVNGVGMGAGLAAGQLFSFLPIHFLPADVQHRRAHHFSAA